jgi:uncharacterized membrane protein YjfL (UPF0719 family)
MLLTLLRWTTSACLAVFLAYSVITGEFKLGRMSIRRREKAATFWFAIGLSVALAVFALSP